MVKDLIVKGTIYFRGKMVVGAYSVLKDEFLRDDIPGDVEGTLLKGPINFHTHLGDAFIREEPEGGIKDIVGPGGFKMRKLDSSPSRLIRESIGRSIEFMKRQGTAAFFDFRESGSKGLKLAPNTKGINGFYMSRPSENGEVIPLLEDSAGFGMSSLADNDLNFLKILSNTSHRHGKLFAIHFSENVRESVNDLIGLKPDYIIHCLETRNEDLEILKKEKIPIVVTPRSNVFHGKRPDYSRLFDLDLKVLLGTDNAFITEPSILDEAAFLYRYQRGIKRVAPEKILATIIDNPREVISRFGLRLGMETYILYPNEALSAYQILTRPNFYEREILVKSEDRITFFPRKH